MSVFDQTHRAEGCDGMAGCPIHDDHENHETLVEGCQLCRRLFEYAASEYRTRQPAYSKDEMDEARQIRPELRR